VVHDTRNMLHVVRMLASNAADLRDIDRNEIEEAIDRADVMLRGLLHPEEQTPASGSDAAKVLRACETRLAAAAHPCPFNLEIEASPCEVSTAPLDLERVVTNLVVNATDASEPDSPICVRLTQADGFAVVEVIDHGRGMPQEELDNARRSGFSTKADGTGLGLVVVESILGKAGGSLTLEAVLGAGTTATCRFPLSDQRLGMPTPNHTG
jgi:signal transduction histidine kinase